MIAGLHLPDNIFAYVGNFSFSEDVFLLERHIYREERQKDVPCAGSTVARAELV